MHGYLLVQIFPQFVLLKTITFKVMKCYMSHFPRLAEVWQILETLAKNNVIWVGYKSYIISNGKEIRENLPKSD